MNYALRHGTVQKVLTSGASSSASAAFGQMVQNT